MTCSAYWGQCTEEGDTTVYHPHNIEDPYYVYKWHQPKGAYIGRTKLVLELTADAHHTWYERMMANVFAETQNLLFDT